MHSQGHVRDPVPHIAGAARRERDRIARVGLRGVHEVPVAALQREAIGKRREPQQDIQNRWVDALRVEIREHPLAVGAVRRVGDELSGLCKGFQVLLPSGVVLPAPSKMEPNLPRGDGPDRPPWLPQWSVVTLHVALRVFFPSHWIGGPCTFGLEGLAHRETSTGAVSMRTASCSAGRLQCRWSCCILPPR